MIACDMAVVHPRDVLVALADREGDVAEGALWIAAEDTSGLDVARWLERIDELAGELLDAEDTRRLVERSTGWEAPRVEPAWLARATTRDILARMSRNLRGCYSCLENWPLALRAADRCVDLLPGDPAERRDRGVLLWRLGQTRAALDDLRWYLERVADDAADRGDIEEIASRLRAFMN